MSFNLFPGYLIALRVPLYDNAVSTVTPVEPQPTATDMNREGFSLDLFLEMHRVYDVDQVFLVTHRCDDGGARLEVSKVEEATTHPLPTPATTHPLPTLHPSFRTLLSPQNPQKETAQALQITSPDSAGSTHSLHTRALHTTHLTVHAEQRGPRAGRC
jgi:hypothetical protein